MVLRNTSPIFLSITWLILILITNSNSQEFNSILLTQNLNSPMQMSIAPDGKIYFAEKAGRIKVYDPTSQQTREIGNISVNEAGEGGMLGIALDPDFITTSHIYLYYSYNNPSEPHEAVVRYTLDQNGNINSASEIIVLKVPDSGENEHSSGGLTFDSQGNLYISVGDDTWIGATDGYAPMDERPGREAYDAQKSSSNNNDLRGSILRIKPLADGTYEIPEGNLFPQGHATGLPEIFIMGCRNPFRTSIDPFNNWLYWAEPGPNARAANINRGPRGHDEINLAKAPGNYGWPYFVGPNEAYVEFDYGTGNSGQTFNPVQPINNSPNNTGDQNLPPAQSAIVWYTYDPFPAWPMFPQHQSSSAMAGPFFRFDPGLQSNNKLDIKFDQSLILFDWGKSFIKYMKVDNQGLPLEILPISENGSLVAPGNQNADINNPMDIKLGPDGVLYVLAWGNNGYPIDRGAGQILRLDYIGTRTHIVKQSSLAFNNSFFQKKFINGQGITLKPRRNSSWLEVYNLKGKLVDKITTLEKEKISIKEKTEGTYILRWIKSEE